MPNLNGTVLLSVTTSSGSWEINGTVTATSTFRTIVPASSTGSAAQETVTSVSIVPGSTSGPVTSTAVSAMGASPSASLTGAADGRWRVGGWTMVAVVVGVLLSAL